MTGAFELFLRRRWRQYDVELIRSCLAPAAVVELGVDVARDPDVTAYSCAYCYAASVIGPAEIQHYANCDRPKGVELVLDILDEESRPRRRW